MLTQIILAAVMIVIIVFLMRLIGPWVFRIDEIIQIQKEILEELRILNGKDNLTNYRK